MADNVTLAATSGGKTVATDEVTDATLGTAQVQYVKIMDGTLDGTNKVSASTAYGLATDVTRVQGTVTVALGAALPTGSNVIGAVTQSGTWNVGLSTGSNVIGAVTQSGIWNVSVNSALPTGTNSIGTVGLSSGAQVAIAAGGNVIGSVTQSGTWNVGSITTLPSLPAGSNVIGAVTQSGTWNVGSITTLPALPAGTNAIGATTNRSGSTVGQGSASPTTSATQIVAAVSSSPYRRAVTITNTGTVNVMVGGSGVTSTTGVLLVPGAAVTITEGANAAIYGITASGTGTVAYFSESD